MIAAIDLGIDISIGRKLKDLAVFQAHDPKIHKRVEAIKQDLRCQIKGTVPAPTRYPLQQWYSTGGTRRHLRGYVDYTICITCTMYQQLWGYKVEEKLYLGVREEKKVEYHCSTARTAETILIGDQCCPANWKNKSQIMCILP
jgi:hypothetical protein